MILLADDVVCIFGVPRGVFIGGSAILMFLGLLFLPAI